MPEKIILTRKIQLLIDSKEDAFLKETYATLYRWQRMCCKAANYIFTHLYLQEQLKELFYLNEATRVKLADIAKDEDGILTTSRPNSTYQVLSKHFKGDMPMGILSCLNNNLGKLYQQERDDYFKGMRSLRNYKRDIPFPVNGTDLRRLRLSEKGNNFCFNLFGIPFRTYLGKDFHDKRELMHKVISGEIKLCASSIMLDRGKIYLLAVFEQEQEQHQLLPGVIAEAALSMEIPIVLTIQKSRYPIGNKEEFLHRRLSIQAAVERVKRGSVFNYSGKGRRRKMKSLEKYKDMEKDYVNHKLHVYSRRVIDLCIKKQAATLLLTNHSEVQEEIKEDNFLLRNWSYGNLKDKIMYKARKAGIAVVEE